MAARVAGQEAANANRPETQTQTKRAMRVVGEEGRTRDMAAAEDRRMRDEKLAHNLLLVERSILLVRLDHARSRLFQRKGRRRESRRAMLEDE